MVLPNDCCTGHCFPENHLQSSEWRVLTASELATLSSKAVCREYGPGAELFHEGDECGGVYFIGDGLIGLRKEDADGNSVLLRLAGPGETLAYRPFLTGSSHSASAEVLEACRICFVARRDLMPMLQQNPDFGLEILRRTAKNHDATETRLHQALTLNARAKFAHLLLIFKDRYGTMEADGALRIDLPISRSDLASMIGLRSESLSRTIHQMTDDGLVRFSGHRAWISDLTKLADEVAKKVEI